MGKSKNSLHDLRSAQDFVSVGQFGLELGDSGAVSVEDGGKGCNSNQAAH